MVRLCRYVTEPFCAVDTSAVCSMSVDRAQACPLHSSYPKRLTQPCVHTVFGFFGDIIGDVFFPKDQGGDTSTMEAFLVFGLAFLVRPIGGMVLGYIGDLYGSKKSLVISIFLMAIPTFAMGCLPSYDQVGPVAIVLLVTVRLLQGLSVGGQLMSSLIFTLENHDPSQWGLYGSFVLAAANFGTLLGSLAGTVLEASLTTEQLKAWGWRIPFLSGILVSLCGLYLQSHGSDGHGNHRRVAVAEEKGTLDDTVSMSDQNDESESDIFAPGRNPVDVAAPASTNPLRQAFRCSNLRALVAAALVPMLWSGGFYFSFVWM
jgi:MFS transporter, MHS family, proline/betaine transporter